MEQGTKNICIVTQLNVESMFDQHYYENLLFMDSALPAAELSHFVFLGNQTSLVNTLIQNGSR
jgi:hypothetical protein